MAIGEPETHVRRHSIVIETPERKGSLVAASPCSILAPDSSCKKDKVVTHHPKDVWHPAKRQNRYRGLTIGPFTVGDKIGEGSCAAVKRAWLSDDATTQYACKVLPKSTDESATNNVLNAEREIELHRMSAAHPNIVGVHAVAGDDKNHYMFQHLASSGDLFDMLESVRTNPPERDVAQLFRGILRGLAHCHSLGIAHRDIKIENVLLEKEKGTGGFGLRPMLCDFGFATTEKWSIDACGTLDYAAPEVLRAKTQPYQPQKSDIWSAGVILYTILTGSLPFDSPTGNKRHIRQRISLANYSLPRHISREASDILKLMLNPDPNARPTAEECLKAPFFATL